MTSVVQRPTSTGNAGVTSLAPVSLTATGVGNSLVLCAILSDGGTSSPVFTISNGGSALTWTVRHNTIVGSANHWYCTLVADVLNAPTSTTSVTVTSSNANSLNGGAVVFEVSGTGTALLDLSQGGDNTTFSFTTVTDTATGTEATASDFVVGACVIRDTANPIGISDPATGNSLTYTSAYLQQNGGLGGGQVSFRIETSAVTNPAATWSWTNGAPYSSAIVAYAFVAPVQSGNILGTSLPPSAPSWVSGANLQNRMLLTAVEAFPPGAAQLAYFSDKPRWLEFDILVNPLVLTTPPFTLMGQATL